MESSSIEDLHGCVSHTHADVHLFVSGYLEFAADGSIKNCTGHAVPKVLRCDPSREECNPEDSSTQFGDYFDTAAAVNDPVFVLHHANVDRIFWSWQQHHKDIAPYYSFPDDDSEPQGTSLFHHVAPGAPFLDSNGEPISNADVLSMQVPYTYDEAVGRALVLTQNELVHALQDIPAWVLAQSQPWSNLSRACSLFADAVPSIGLAGIFEAASGRDPMLEHLVGSWAIHYLLANHSRNVSDAMKRLVGDSQNPAT